MAGPEVDSFAITPSNGEKAAGYKGGTTIGDRVLTECVPGDGDEGAARK